MLKKHRPKKSLGQNFLTDKNIVNLIINLAKISENDTVLEVGPGTGVLTDKIILKRPKKYFLVEKDNFLSNNLKSKHKDKINIVNDDILKISEEKLSKEKMIVIGNLPYNISTQILVKWIKKKNLHQHFTRLILMFQKEVADRIVAKVNTKNYGRISILSSWKLKIKKIKEINPNSFYPKPKVKSTILFIEPREEFIKFKKVENLEYLTRIFFNTKRKMIKKALNKVFANPKKILESIPIDVSLRPQNLEPEIYYKLCKELEKLIKQ